MISSKIIADSIDSRNNRLTTFIVTFPRIILSEFNTHRMFSRNSASSRAIPFEKMVRSVEENPFIPIAWQKNHKGMQGTEYISETDIYDYGDYQIPVTEILKEDWLLARDLAISQSENLYNNQVTKQLCNRLLEPFMWHTVIITSSREGLENFFELRCPNYQLYRGNFKSKKDFLKSSNRFAKEFEGVEFNDEFFRKNNISQAEIHIQALAESMWDAICSSEPKKLNQGDWHLPMIEIEEDE